jgi:hypothetical protein
MSIITKVYNIFQHLVLGFPYLPHFELFLNIVGQEIKYKTKFDVCLLLFFTVHCSDIFFLGKENCNMCHFK